MDSLPHRPSPSKTCCSSSSQVLKVGFEWKQVQQISKERLHSIMLSGIFCWNEIFNPCKDICPTPADQVWMQILQKKYYESSTSACFARKLDENHEGLMKTHVASKMHKFEWQSILQNLGQTPVKISQRVFWNMLETIAYWPSDQLRDACAMCT